MGDNPIADSNAEQIALRAALAETYTAIKRALVQGDWEGVEDAFRGFCDANAELISAWFVDEYVFQAMRLWSDNRLDQVLRHFARFINRAADLEMIDLIAETEEVRMALYSPDEKPTLVGRQPSE